MRAQALVLSFLIFSGLLLAAADLAAGEDGHGKLEGRVHRPDGDGVGGVTVLVQGTSSYALTRADGSFSLGSLAPGAATVSLSLGDLTSQREVEIGSEGVTRLDLEVDWDLSFADSITVRSASRRPERIVEAPAAVSVVTPLEIERRAAQGQIPKLLEFGTAVELSQASIYDFNLNTRGFNSSINRRVLMLVDGRDPSVPFLGNQDWAALSFPLDEFESVELVRGPGSALYGGDAFNGVLNVVTKEARETQGGRIKMVAGEQDTVKADLRYAGSFGNGWYYRVLAGGQEADDFVRSRTESVEYAPGLLPPERVPVDPHTEIAYGGLRLDKHFGNGHVLTVEGGTSTLDGITVLAEVGRLQGINDIQRPWARFNYNSSWWNFLAYYNERDAPDQRTLFTDDATTLSSTNSHFEFQANTSFLGGRGRLIGGASFGTVKIDSANPRGVQTLMFAKRDEDEEALFGQLELQLTDDLRAVVALRLDDGSLIDTQVSPRASLVWAASPKHHLRLSFSQAYQTPNFSEFFLQIPVAPSVDLSPVEQGLGPLLGGVGLGFGSIPILALGNSSLDVEEIRGFEVGYNGVLGRRVFLTVDVYRNELENFITELLPQLGTSLGRLNPNFGPYVPPEGLPPGADQILLGVLQASLPPELFAALSNNVDGSPIFAVLSYANFGKVDSSGVEIGLSYAFKDDWALDFSYSYFDFDVQEDLLESPILPNAPENKLKLGLTYTGEKLNAGARMRWVDDFPWSAGVFVGPVPSFTVVDLSAGYQVSDSWRVGLDVSNLFDNEHYELFGGSLIERRALAYLSFDW